jgi:large subunit ribosomal protein L18
MDRIRKKRKLSRRRASRRRSRITGTDRRLRLSVFRSLNHIYGQLIDDINGKTLYSLSSRSSGVTEDLPEDADKTGIARKVGEEMGKKTLELGIRRVIFDVGPYKYHGRVKAFADSFREAGVKF